MVDRFRFYILGVLAIAFLGLLSSTWAKDSPSFIQLNAKDRKRLTERNDAMLNYLNQKNQHQIIVTEFFNYACPHCASFNRQLHQWADKHDKVKLLKVPVSFGRTSWKVLAKAYYVSLVLSHQGGEKSFSLKLFTAIHQKGKKIDSKHALAKFFMNHSVKKQTFNQYYDAFMIEKWYRQDQNLVNQLSIMSVPTIIIANRYRLKRGVNDRIEVMSQILKKVKKDH
jgi:thiol:disulfide interchange protein DsbA